MNVIVDQAAEDCIRLVQDLSVLIITYPGKWREEEFNPSELSVRRIEWFEGTGTVIGLKRNRVFIHCEPKGYSFFVKGCITNQKQVMATLSINQYEAANNGIDIALLSCDASCFDPIILQRMIQNLKWDFSSLDSGTLTTQPLRLYLVHYPTLCEQEQNITRRLYQPVFSDISVGYLLAIDSDCFDSSVEATAGSSGGLLISEQGVIVGSHDSQHNDTIDGTTVWTHRMCVAIRESLSSFRGSSEFFSTH